MEEHSVNKFHIRHLMLYEFQKHNTTNATNAIINDVLNTRIYQYWFKKI